MISRPYPPEEEDEKVWVLYNDFNLSGSHKRLSLGMIDERSPACPIS